MRFSLVLLTTIVLFAAIASQAQDDVKIVAPDYPADVLAQIVGEHEVKTYLRINEKGKVGYAFAFGPWKTCDGNDDLREIIERAVIQAAKDSTFPAAQYNGKNVDGVLRKSYLVVGTKKAEPINATDIRSGRINGRALSLPRPGYPTDARKYTLTGSVDVRVQIDEQGKVVYAFPESGEPILLKAAADAACKAKFTPPMQNGKAVKLSGIITYNFIP